MELGKSPMRRNSSHRRRASFGGRAMSSDDKKSISTPAYERFYKMRQSYRQRVEVFKRRRVFLTSYHLSLRPTRRQAIAGIVKRLLKVVQRTLIYNCSRGRHTTTLPNSG